MEKLKKKVSCPDCKSALDFVKSEFGPIYICFTCFGHLLKDSDLRQILPQDLFEQFTGNAGTTLKNYLCPACAGRVERIEIPCDGKTEQAVHCRSCSLFWIKNNVMNSLPFNAATSQRGPSAQTGSSTTRIKEQDQDMVAKALLESLHIQEQKKRLSERSYSDSGDYEIFDFDMD